MQKENILKCPSNADNISMELQILLGLKEQEVADFLLVNKTKPMDNLISTIFLYIKDKQVVEKPIITNTTNGNNKTLIEKFSYKPPQLLYDEYIKNFKEEILLKEAADQTNFSSAFFEVIEETKESQREGQRFDLAINPKILSVAIECFEKGANIIDRTKPVTQHHQPNKNIKIMKKNFGKNHGGVVSTGANTGNSGHSGKADYTGNNYNNNNSKSGYNNKNAKDNKKTRKVNTYYDDTVNSTPNPADNKNLISTQGKNNYVAFDPFSEEGSFNSGSNSNYNNNTNSSSNNNNNNNNNNNINNNKNSYKGNNTNSKSNGNDYYNNKNNKNHYGEHQDNYYSDKGDYNNKNKNYYNATQDNYYEGYYPNDESGTGFSNQSSGSNISNNGFKNNNQSYNNTKKKPFNKKNY